jgi:hypothetical protein
MERTSQIIIFIVGLISVLPGIPFLTNKLILPVENDILHTFFIAIIEILSFCSFLILWIKRKKISRMKENRFIKIMVVSFISFFIFLITYIFLYYSSVYYPPEYDAVFVPIFRNSTLNQFILNHGGNVISVVVNHGRDTLVEEIQNVAKVELFFSVLLFLLTYILTFLSILIALFSLAIRVQQNESKKTVSK